MPQFNNVMIVRENAVGESTVLLFPELSTCTALVAVLSNALVGAHMTCDSWLGEDPDQFTRATLDRLAEKIAGRQIDSLLMVGFNNNHNPPKLAAELNVPTADCEAYDIARKGVSVVTVIVSHLGQGVRPKVEYKRQTKVDYAQNPIPNYTKADMDKGHWGNATTGKLHELRKHFVGVL